MKDIEINSNEEVVEVELCSMEFEKLNAHLEEEEEVETQKENDELNESSKENVEGDHAEDFSSNFSKEDVNDIKIKLIDETCYMLNFESDEWFDVKK